MLRVPLSKSYLKRSLKILYGFNQTTPKSQYLDPAWDRSIDIYPGMAAMKTAGDLVTLNNSTGNPIGLFGVYIGGDGIDELLESGVNACPVWVMDADAEFEVLAPAFDTTPVGGSGWVDPGDGTIALVHAHTGGGSALEPAKRGKLVPSDATNASTKPVARLIRVDSATKIVVGGLFGTA